MYNLDGIYTKLSSKLLRDRYDIATTIDEGNVCDCLCMTFQRDRTFTSFRAPNFKDHVSPTR